MNENESFRSRVNPKRSLVDREVMRSKITLKKNRDTRPTIKKMTDVEEIRSLVDS